MENLTVGSLDFNVTLTHLKIQENFKWSNTSQLGNYEIYQTVPLQYCIVYGLSTMPQET